MTTSTKHLMRVYDRTRGQVATLAMGGKMYGAVLDAVERLRWLNGLRPDWFATFPADYRAHPKLRRIEIDGSHLRAMADWMGAQRWHGPVGLGVEADRAPERYYALFADERDRMLFKLRW